MRSPEYIGVSGVVNQEQQVQLEQMFADVGLNGLRKLQCGVKATHKPQYLGVENKYGREWYPVGREIDDVMRFGRGVTGVAQVCFDSELVHDDSYRQEFLKQAFGHGANQWLTGIQFDMLPDWVEQTHLAERTLDDALYTMWGNRSNQTILQCQSEIMERHTSSEVADALAGFRMLDHVLLDSSGGRGIRMNVEALLPYIDQIYNDPRLSNLGVAVGGGLNAQVVREELPKILRHFPDVSWDAEGQLHPVDINGKRPLDMQICQDYIEASADVLR